MIENRIVPNTDENISKCQCPDCPVYNDCMNSRNEKIYCSDGKTVCDFNKVGSALSTCPIWIEYNLNSLFYCEKGAAE